MAEGGRSSRSFINEGRLTKKTGSSRTPIEGNIKAGDYLMIQFAHNDEETNGDRFLNYIDRKVPLGTPDTNGIFPTTLPTLVSTETLPTEFEEGATETAKTSAKNVIKAYGSEYYSFDCGGTFKGYLKMYIDFARSVGATPILCTPVARVKYDSTGKTIIGGNGKHGPNFEYVLAVRQLATEENCLLIDTFDFSKRVLEQATIAEGNNFMALKPNSLIGLWPNDYDAALSGNGAKYTGIEGTHYNKYGAYLQAAFIADEFAKMAENNTTASGTEKITFGSSVLSTPTRVVVPSSRIKAETTTAISQFFTKVNVA